MEGTVYEKTAFGGNLKGVYCGLKGEREISEGQSYNHG